MVKHQIVMQRAEVELVLTLLDTKLIILQGQGETKTRIDQEFPSEAALVEHALRVVKLRQQEGFRVIGERKADQIVMPPEPTDADEKEPAPKA
ncbi:MAG: hypothetical protein QM831_16965 [Kofleriaceae bacterium]